MTDKLEVFSNAIQDVTDNNTVGQANSHPEGDQSIGDQSISVELPSEIVHAIEQHLCQSGQPFTGQTPTQAALDLLRSALGLDHPPPPHAAPSAPTAPPAKDALAHLLAEFQQLKIRLDELETVVPRVEQLEGKSIAF